MSRNISNLRIGVGIDPREMNRGAQQVRKTLRSLASVAKVAGIAAGAAFSAGAIGMGVLAKKGLVAVDAQAKMARSVDGTVDGLRALQIAGGDAGVATEAVGASMQKMGAKLAEAARDGFGPAHEALQLLGLDAAELIALDVDDRLAAIADKAKEFGMSAQATADILAQFGVRNKEMALLVMQGGDAIRGARQEVRDFGLSLDKEGVAGVERANDAMARIGFVFEGFRNQLAIAVAPALEAMAAQFKTMMETGGPLQQSISLVAQSFGDLVRALSDPDFLQAATTIGVGMVDAVRSLADVLVVLTDNAEIAAAGMVALGSAMAFFSGPIGLAITLVAGGIGILATRMGTAQTAADELTIAEHDLSVAIAAVDMKNRDAVASGEAMITTHIDRARAAVEAAKAELALAQAEEARINSMTENGHLRKLTDKEKDLIAQRLEALQNNIGPAEDLLERLQKTLEGFQRSKFPSQGVGRGDGSVPPPTSPGSDLTLQQELAELIKTLDPAVARAEKYDQSIAILKRALADGAITQDEYNLRVEQLNEKLKDVPGIAGSAAAGIKKIREELTSSQKINKEFADGLDSAFDRLIDNIESGMDAVKAFGIEVLKLLTIRGISRILGTSDWFDGPLITPGANALGTDHWRGGLSWVGERGPELVNLPRGAQVIPNHRLGGLGGDTVLNYAPNIDAKGADAGRLAQLEQTMKQQAERMEATVVSALRSAQKKRMV